MPGRHGFSWAWVDSNYANPRFSRREGREPVSFSFASQYSAQTRYRPMSNQSKPTVEFTDLAKGKVLRFMQIQGTESLAVRIQVASPSPLDPRYDITMIEPDEKCAEDVVFDGYQFCEMAFRSAHALRVGCVQPDCFGNDLLHCFINVFDRPYTCRSVSSFNPNHAIACKQRQQCSGMHISSSSPAT